MSVRERLSSERGDTLISGLLALGLVLLTVGLAVQALCSRTPGQSRTRQRRTACRRPAPKAPARASLAPMRFSLPLEASAHTFDPSAHSNTSVVTVVVQGSAPHLFPGVDLMLPTITATASEPLERYPQDEE